MGLVLEVDRRCIGELEDGAGSLELSQEGLLGVEPVSM